MQLFQLFIPYLFFGAIACWVYWDAKKKGYYPFAAICLTIGTVFLPIVFIPLYLFARGNRRFNINPDTKTVGIVMLVIGVIGLVGVYSVRPPSGFGDAIMMMGQGRGCIRDPFYQIFMAVFGLISFFGVLKIVKDQKEGKEK